MQKLIKQISSNTTLSNIPGAHFFAEPLKPHNSCHGAKTYEADCKKIVIRPGNLSNAEPMYKQMEWLANRIKSARHLLLHRSCERPEPMKTFTQKGRGGGCRRGWIGFVSPGSSCEQRQRCTHICSRTRSPKWQAVTVRHAGGDKSGKHLRLL